MDDRRVTKHRRTLNERRGSSGEAATSVPDAGRTSVSSSLAVEKPRLPRVSEDLIRLACLWQAGALSDSEFEAAKAKVLASYWGTRSAS